jgi:hypothetical protein
MTIGFLKTKAAFVFALIMCAQVDAGFLQVGDDKYPFNGQVNFGEFPSYSKDLKTAQENSFSHFGSIRRDSKKDKCSKHSKISKKHQQNHYKEEADKNIYDLKCKLSEALKEIENWKKKFSECDERACKLEESNKELKNYVFQLKEKAEKNENNEKLLAITLAKVAELRKGLDVANERLRYFAALRNRFVIDRKDGKSKSSKHSKSDKKVKSKRSQNSSKHSKSDKNNNGKCSKSDKNKKSKKDHSSKSDKKWKIHSKSNKDNGWNKSTFSKKDDNERRDNRLNSTEWLVNVLKKRENSKKNSKSDKFKNQGFQSFRPIVKVGDSLGSN